MVTALGLRAGEAVLGGVVLGLGLFVGVETALLEVAPSNAAIGPRLFPFLVAAGLVSVGVLVLRQALQQVLPAMAPVPMLPARRSVFRRGAGVMLVTEVFLPDLLARPSRGLRQSRPSDRGPD